MHITQVNTTSKINACGDFGGAEVVALAYETALTSAGHDVSYMVPADTRLRASIGSGAACTELHPHMTKDPKVMFQIAVGARRLKPDLLISHGRASAAHAVPASVVNGIPHITVVHGETFGLLPYLAQGFISVSPALVDGIVASGVRPDQIRVVENFIDLDIPVLSRKEVGAQPVIGYLGRLSEEKGPDIFIETLSRLQGYNPNVRAVIGGTGGMEPVMRELADRYNVAESIEWMGWVTDRKAFFDKIDVLVVPSRSEGFGMVILEAWANGVPVVSTDTVGPRKLITDGVTGILADKSPTSLALATLILLDDAGKYSKMAQASHDAVRAYHIDRRGRNLHDAVVDLRSQCARRPWFRGLNAA